MNLKMNISNRDKKLLLVLAGVLVFVITIFLIFNPARERNEALKAEIAQLEAKVAELEQLEAEKATYEAEIKNMGQEIEKLTKEFPADTKEEDAVFFAHNMEQDIEGDLSISAVTMGNPEPIVSASGNGSEYTMNLTKNSYVYSADYKAMKNFIKEINAHTDKVTIQSMNASYDGSSGLLSGTFETNFFTMAGTDRTYEVPNLPIVEKSTDNLFKTND